MHSTCPRCGRLILSEDLASRLCATCVAQVESTSGGETEAAVFAESARIGLGRSLLRFLWTIFCGNTLVALMITSLFALFGLAILLASLFGGIVIPNQPPVQLNAAQVLGMPLVVLMMFGFAWCFVSLATIPLSSWYLICDFRGREVRLDDDQIHVRCGFSKWSQPIGDCSFASTRYACDALGFYAPTHPYVLICTKEQKQNVVCGLTAETALAWREQLTRAGMAERPSMWSLSLMLSVAAFGFVGAMVGVLPGWLLTLATGHAGWIAATSFLGGMDAGIARIVLYFAKLSDQSRAWLREHYGPLVCAVAFAALGVKIGALAGIPGLIVLPIANALVGVWLAWVLHRTLRSEGENDHTETRREGA